MQHNANQDRIDPAEERLHELVLRYAPELWMEIDGSGLVRQATTEFEALLGYGPNELIGRHYSAFVHPDHVEWFECHRNSAWAGNDQSASWTALFTTREDGHVSLKLRKEAVTCVSGNSARIIQAEVLDPVDADPPSTAIGERRQSHHDRARVIGQLVQQITAARDQDDVYTDVLGAVSRLIETGICILGVVDPDSGDLICQGVRLSGDPPDSSRSLEGDIVLDRAQLALTLAGGDHQRYFASDTPRQFPFVTGLPGGDALESAVLTPVLTGSVRHGALIAASSIRNAFSTAERDAMRLIASLLGARLQNADLYAAYERHERDLVEVEKINRLVMSNLDVDATVQTILASAPRVLDAQGSSVRIVDGDALIPLAFLGQSAGSFPERVPLSGSLAGIVIERAIPMLISDLRTNPRTRNTVAQKGIAARGWAAAPLTDMDGKPFGVLSVHTDMPKRWSERDRSLLVTLANATSIAYRNSQLFEQTRDMLRASVDSLASAVDAKDSYTHDHSQNVAYYARSIAEHMRLEPEKIDQIELAGLLHDIGKIGIPDRILGKRGALNPAEWAAIQLHTAIGERILSGNPILEPLRPIIRHHHERWDGSGYPDQLHGNEIPLGAAIVGLADAVDTMSRDRPYQGGRVWRDTLAEVERFSGAQFQPEAVRALLDAARSGIIVPRASTPELASFTSTDADSRYTLPVDPRALAIFRRVATEIRGLVDLDMFLTNITGILIDVLQLKDEQLALFLTDEETGDLVLSGNLSGGEPRRLPADTGVTGWVARHGVSQNIPDVRSDPRFIPNNLIATASELAAPLIAADSVIGVINIESTVAAAFTDADERLLVSTGDHLAHAIRAARLHDQFKRMSATDALTGLANHREFYERLRREIARPDARNSVLSVAIMDINQLKVINDTHGHLAGDEALRSIAGLLNANVRPTDLVSRYGGDEFAVILPDTGSDQARNIIGYLETLIEHSQFTIEGAGHRPLPVGSWGSATFPADGDRPSELVHVADKRMYQAKARTGR